MKRSNLRFFIFFLSLPSILNAQNVSKHFLNAKLSYINSDFNTSLKECKDAISYKEVTTNEVEEFLNLITYIKNFSNKKLNEAKKYYENKIEPTYLTELMHKT